jgi:hypothetical protein
MTPRIGSFDIETMSNKAYVWGKYEQDVIAYIEEGYMLSWSFKELGGKQITKGLCDYPGYNPNKPDDKLLVKELHELVDEYDILIAHNGDRFDIKKMNTRFIFHGLTPPEPYKTVDTLKVARNKFAFNGNFLQVGRKVKHPGFDLWLGCEKGDPKAWDLMLKYNRQDVLLLESVYLKLRPWMTTHPNMSLEGNCQNCGGKTVINTRTYMTKKGEKTRLQCQCGHWN